MASNGGRIEATTDPNAVTRQAWADLSRLLGLLAGLVAVLCFLVFVVVAHALRPTGQILAGVNRLANGDLSCRLPPFELNELQRISEVVNDLAQRLQTATRERSDLARKLVDAQERERSHLARELHDDVAQRLTALTLLAKSIRESVGTSAPSVASESEAFVDMTVDAMRSLRTTLIHLRPPEIDDLGLLVGLEELIAGHNRQCGGRIRFTLRADGGLNDLPPETAAHVYRIVQEGLNNAVRHADAKNVDVTLETLHAASVDEIRLTVADDGHGASTEAHRRHGGGVGLIGMRERVYALNGQMTTEPGPTAGFRLIVGFPTTLEMKET